MARAYIGTSGCSYPEWRPAFYPTGTRPTDFLTYYASRLPAVEIDGTFYRIPTDRAIQAWSDSTPEAFRFAVKASQRITHFGRLKLPLPALDRMLEAVGLLGPKLGALLFQLPPTMARDLERLATFCDALPPSLPAVFEFRHRSWFGEETYALLRAAGAGLCIADDDATGTTPLVTTARRIYLRLRRAEYGADDQARWARQVRAWVEAGHDVYAFVKHEENPDSPFDAERLRAAVDAT